MNYILFGMDFANGPSRTVCVIYYSGKRGGKTHFMNLWKAVYCPDMLSRELIRRLAAEAILNVIISN
jgi:hypothetical protein